MAIFLLGRMFQPGLATIAFNVVVHDDNDDDNFIAKFLSLKQA